MITYSSKEAAVKLGVSTRAIQKRCIKTGVRKKDNIYLITDLVLNKWAKEIKSNEPTNVPVRGTQDWLKDITNFQNFKLENNIKVERAKKNITQAELAALIKVSRQTINAMELGKLVPSTVLALKLAHVFEIEVSQLFTLEGSDQ